MSWLFEKNLSGWPLNFIYAFEASCIAIAGMALICLVVSGRRSYSLWRECASVLGGAFAGLAAVIPVALAPFFFHTNGEIMLATLPLSLIAGPILMAVFIYLFGKVFGT